MTVTPAVPPDEKFARFYQRCTSLMFLGFGAVALVLAPVAVMRGSATAFFLALCFAAVFALGPDATSVKVRDLFQIKGKRR